MAGGNDGVNFSTQETRLIMLRLGPTGVLDRRPTKCRQMTTKLTADNGWAKWGDEPHPSRSAALLAHQHRTTRDSSWQRHKQQDKQRKTKRSQKEQSIFYMVSGGEVNPGPLSLEQLEALRLLLLQQGVEPNPGPPKIRPVHRGGGRGGAPAGSRDKRAQISSSWSCFRRSAAGQPDVHDGPPRCHSEDQAGPAPLEDCVEVERAEVALAPEYDPTISKRPKVRRPPPGLSGGAQDILVEHLRDEQSKSLGNRDALDEVAEEAAIAAATVLLSDKKSAAIGRLYTFNQIYERFNGTSFHSFNPGSLMARWCWVARTIHELYIPPCCCNIVEVMSITVNTATQWKLHGAKLVLEPSVNQTPKGRELAGCKGEYHIIAVDVVIHHLTLGGHVGTNETATVYFSLEQWCNARTRRIVGDSFSDTVSLVGGYRRSHMGYIADDYCPDLDSHLSDMVFAAFLMSERSSLEAPDTLYSGLFIHAFTNACNLRIKQGQPIAGGTYVRGYDVGFSDVFPTEWADILRDTLAGVPIRQAAHNAFTRMCVAGAAVGTSVRHKLDRESFVSLATKARDRADYQVRMLPGFIEGLFPAFPARTPETQILGTIKRLVLAVLPGSDEGAKREDAISEVLIEQLAGLDWVFNPVHIHDAALKHVREVPGWSANQVRDFTRGVEDVLREAANGTLVAFLEENRQFFESVCAFLKDECYDYSEMKTPRFIVAPVHYLRGITFALFFDAQRNFFTVVHHNSIKHASVEETTESIAETERGEGVVSLNTDYSSFERQVTSLRRDRESRVIAAAAPQQLRSGILTYGTILGQENMLISGNLFSAVVGTMRQSGEYPTSLGNWITNHNITFAALSQADGVSLPGISAWYHDWQFFWKFEGDDGLMTIPRGLAGKLAPAFTSVGARIKAAIYDDPNYASFCGRMIVEVNSAGGKLTRVVACHPLKALAKMFSDLSPCSDSNVGDLPLLVSKALGLGKAFKHVAGVWPVACRVVRTHAALARALASDDHSGKGMGRAFKYLYSLAYSHGTLEETGITLGLVDEMIAADIAGPCEITAAAEPEICERYGINPETLRRATAALLHSVKTRMPSIKCEAVDVWAATQDTLCAMTSEVVTDLRTKVKNVLVPMAFAKEAVVKAKTFGLEKCMNLYAAFLFLVSMISGFGTWLVAPWFALGGAMYASYLGAVLTTGLGGLLGVAAFVWLAWLALLLSLWLPLGMGFGAARKVAAAYSWLSVIMLIRVFYSCYVALCQSISLMGMGFGLTISALTTGPNMIRVPARCLWAAARGAFGL